MIKNQIAICIAALSGVVGFLYFDTTTTYRIDGWCLAVDTAKLPEHARHVNAAGAFPKFDLDLESEITVRMSVSKSSMLSYVQQIEGNLWPNCPRGAFDYGLQVIEQPSDGECRIPRSSSYYVPTEPEVGSLAVLIGCSKTPQVVNCSLYGVRFDGWEVRVSLPLENIRDWKAVADRSQSLFDAALSDCGGGDI